MNDPANIPDTERLPNLYQRWVDELLPGGIPREQVATCLECVMCPLPGETPDPALQQYNPASKCCTYFPSLPNYLVGAALDVDSDGASALRDFVAHPEASRAQVTLFGVTPNRKFVTLFGSMSNELFGHDAELLCPYAIEADTPEGPLCGIWQHRNAVCSTYFCKHVRGHTGDVFWNALRNLLLSVEKALAWWCIGEVVGEVNRVLEVGTGAAQQDNALQLRDDAWRAWPDTPAAFYRACADRAATLTWADVRDIAGIETRTHERSVLARYARLMSDEVPTHLRAKPIRLIRVGAERTMLQGDPPGEYFELPSVIVQLLPYFDGRATRDIVAGLQEEHGLEIDLGLLRQLCDFGVLEAAPAR